MTIKRAIKIAQEVCDRAFNSGTYIQATDDRETDAIDTLTEWAGGLQKVTNKNYAIISQAIWRSGYVPDKNKVRQAAKEKMRHLVAVDIASSIKKDDPQFDVDEFVKACGFTY